METRLPDASMRSKNLQTLAQAALPAFPAMISSYSVNILFKPNIKPSKSTPKGWLLARA